MVAVTLPLHCRYIAVTLPLHHGRQVRCLWLSRHVNNHGLPYLRRIFEGLGYRVRD